KIIERAQPEMNAPFEGDRTLADVLMAPTRVYVKPVLALLEKVTVKGMAHITGGGLLENVPRVLPENTVAVLEKSAWSRPPLFDWLQQEGQVAEEEMHRVFNCGIGMVVIVAREDADAAQSLLQQNGETVWRIGRIAARQGKEAQTRVA
ncbi:MAG: phosphoribosylformylglycinamidine cyclo-ligase, partial [Zoogloeaceae bacterium]|nr:phosphoribosylformylglycinamidine cyclo-ligase [Zoogloeaceae bacterium]